jgi:predicted O-methyltransferase YrrM
MAIEYPYPNMEKNYVNPLKQLMKVLKPESILEVGLGQWGFSTRVWLENSNAHVTSVDKGDWNGLGKEYFEKYPKRFNFIKGYTDDVLPLLAKEFDFIYIDGDHSYEGSKADMINCQKLLLTDGVILLDDYGVEHISAVNVDDNGNPIDDYFGVKQAADEVFKGWKQVYKDIDFANGGRAYAKT